MPADQLYVEVPHLEHALGRLRRTTAKASRQQVVQRLAVLVALLEFVGLGRESCSSLKACIAGSSALMRVTVLEYCFNQSLVAGCRKSF